MKKSNTRMLAATCVMLYIACTLRRPLFWGELSSPAINDFVLRFFGSSVFALRMISVAAVFCGVCCVLAMCRSSENKKILPVAALLFLTNFFVFCTGISGGAAALGGFFCILSMTLLYWAFTLPQVWKKILCGIGCGGLLFGGLALHVPQCDLQQFLPVLFPWVLFVPSTVRKVKGQWGNLRQDKCFCFAVWMTAVWGVTALVSRRPEALYPAAAGASILLAQLVCRLDKTAYDRTLNYFAGALLPFPVLLFIWQTVGRFTDWIPPKYLFYMKGENYFVPVIALTLLIVWWKMAVREEDELKKFLYVCAGVAFVLLALPNSIPVKYLRQEAAQEFFNTTVKHISPGKNARFLASGKEMRQAVRWCFSKNAVEEYVPSKLDRKHETLIFTGNKADVKALPHPKNYYTNGKFYIIYYPERRIK